MDDINMYICTYVCMVSLREEIDRFVALYNY